MIRRFAAGLLALLLTGALAGCAGPDGDTETAGGLRIVATLFPQYDFARQLVSLAGQEADISLLLPPGTESHAYEPTTADMLAIHGADLFLYTGDAMEPWARTVIDGLDDSAVQVVDMAAGITLTAVDEDDGHEGHTHAAADGVAVDPHIWTSPVLAQRMVATLADALCAADPTHTDAYRTAQEDYTGQLSQLDADIRAALAGYDGTPFVFGGRFAFTYFFREYGLAHRAAYDSCSHEAEPSAAVMASLIDLIRDKHIGVVYYEELTDPKIARTLCDATGADSLLLHSCHNVSKEERAAGVTYLSLMRQNLDHLVKGLTT